MSDVIDDSTNEIAALAKDEAVNRLKTALRELDSGEGLSVLTGGHGLQSRTFEFSWSSPTLAISFSMPYSRVLDDDDVRQADDAAIGVACRLAILLIESDTAGLLYDEGETAISVSFDRLTGAHYQILGADGEIIDSGSDWTGLIARLERVIQSNGCEAVSIIWP